MVLRSLLLALLTFIVWSLAIRLLPVELDTRQSLWNENVIAAERYLVEAPDDGEHIAILGSSLSQLLVIDSAAGLPVFNLGLGGQGVSDGLHLLATGPAPAMVLVEVNIIIKEENEDFRDAIVGPFRGALLRWVPALRQEYQPVGVGLGIFKRLAGRKRPAPAGPTDRETDEPSLAAKRVYYADPAQPADLRSRLTALKARLQPLTIAGAEIVFFEAPVHPDLCNSPRARSVRTGVRSVFPPTQYTYLPQPDCADYVTTDGHHLGNLSRTKYAEWLRARISEI